MDEEDYACGNIRGTVYGPEKFLSEKQKRFRRMNLQEYNYYMDKVEESGGFDVDGCTGAMTGRISPLLPGCHEWELAEIVAKTAALKQGETMGEPIEFLRLMKANVQPVSGIMYYLTFIAITGDQMEKTYKAKVWRKPVTRECEILFFGGESDVSTNWEEDITSGIKFNLGPYLSKSLEEDKFNNPTIEPKPGQLQKDGCGLLMEKLKRQNPHWTHDKASITASRMWKLFKYPEKAPFLDGAWKMFKKKYPQFYPDVKE